MHTVVCPSHAARCPLLERQLRPHAPWTEAFFHGKSVDLTMKHVDF